MHYSHVYFCVIITSLMNCFVAHTSHIPLGGNNKFKSLAVDDEQTKFQELSAEFSHFNRPRVTVKRAKEIFSTAINPEKLINQQEKFFGNTLLMDAIAKENSKVAEYLLTVPGLNPNIQNKAGETALILATKRQLPSVVKGLLNLGADVAKQDKFGTALYWTRYFHNPEIQKMLMGARTPQMIEEMIAQQSLSRGITPLIEAPEEPEEKE